MKKCLWALMALAASAGALAADAISGPVEKQALNLPCIILFFIFVGL